MKFPRRWLRRRLGIDALEERLHELEDHVRVIAGRGREATVLDLLVERVEALVAALPGDAEAERLAGEARRAVSIRGRADEIAALHRRIDRLEEWLLEASEETRERAARRWRRARPDDRLTWHTYLAGDAFVDRMEAWDAFSPGAVLLEVGPGYGRLLRTILERGLPFRSYVGLDLSAENVEALRALGAEYRDPRLRFLVGDAEEASVGEELDVVFSSLTFKHIYPSFEGALANLARQLRPGGRVMVDLIEGSRRFFEADGVTYLRWYERGEVREILERTGLELVAFDEVRHDEEHPRLLVVARRPA